MPPELPALVDARMRDWANAWSLPELPGALDVRVSTRLRTTLGLCRPRRGEIRVAAFLLEAPREMLEEVVCHEMAHAAAFRLHGARIRPHGPEWKDLMRRAGFAPRARVAADVLARLPERVQRARVRWTHRCDTCGIARDAGRPVREWSCGRCRQAGRAGRLTITRHPAQRDRAARLRRQSG